jgi:hypothetical protein
MNGNFAVFDGLRTPFTSQVVPDGRSAKETVRVVAPSLKGNFKLTLTLVQEGASWFVDKRFKCATANVVVG